MCPFSDHLVHYPWTAGGDVLLIETTHTPVLDMSGPLLTVVMRFETKASSQNPQNPASRGHIQGEKEMIAGFRDHNIPWKCYKLPGSEIPVLACHQGFQNMVLQLMSPWNCFGN